MGRRQKQRNLLGACSNLKTFVTIDADMTTKGGTTNGMANSGPPYLPSIWAVGGAPKLDVDVPITAIFLFLYLCGAITHMIIFQLNRRRDHKFIFSALMFGKFLPIIARKHLLYRFWLMNRLLYGTNRNLHNAYSCNLQASQY